MKAVPRISFVFQRGVICLLMSVMLSGCERTFMSTLEIRNDLRSPVVYCYDLDATTCDQSIKAGQVVREAYMGRTRDEDNVEIFEAFDRQYLKICGRKVGFGTVRSISPVIEHGDRRFEIVIDKTVEEALCQ
ncbi:hypothetical protein [Pseudomonas sp. Marseille-P9899]|uniref:hypothetical protein n=1 Tax=Pseudomonas sp. Marseille-P9899 TaxID=2730401 RepID=UPI001588C2FB|nr:hypothetical protein [Pseudomonas sp. Marseille-P9899]